MDQAPPPLTIRTADAASTSRWNWMPSPAWLPFQPIRARRESGSCSAMPLRWDRPQSARLEVLEGLVQLVAGVHHEGAVLRHRLADRLPAHDVDIEGGAAAVL